MLSLPFNTCNGSAVKWRVSGKCHTELAVIKKKQAMVDIFQHVYASALERY
jgi:hypothetical protein